MSPIQIVEPKPEHDLELLDDLHLRIEDEDGGGFCSACELEWPCGAVRLMAQERGLERLRKIAERAQELEALFNLQWEAEQRGIKRWQDAHPDQVRVWPDRANMVTWLIEQWDDANENFEFLAAALNDITHVGLQELIDTVKARKETP